MISTMEPKHKIKVWTIVFWLLVWELLSLAINNRIFLVPPHEVLIRLQELSLSSSFWLSVVISLSKIVSGFLLAFLSALLSAFLAYRFKRIGELLAPLVLVIKSIPVASFVILVLLWTSSKNLAIVIAFLMVYPIIFENALKGLNNTAQEKLELVKTYRLSNFACYRYLYLESLLPFLESALYIAIGLAFKAGIAAEIIGLPEYGLGTLLYESKLYFATSDLFAYTLVIIILSLATQKLFLYLFKTLKGRLLGCV